MSRDGRRASDPSSTRELMASYGEQLEELVVLSRGSELAREDALKKALVLERNMRRLDDQLLERGASERTVLQVLSVLLCI